MKKILFVCTGNTCRSSMAEAMFKEMLKTEGELFHQIQVLSAGTHTIKGGQASLNAIEVMREKGISLEDHRTTPLTKNLIEEADLVLTMTVRHKRMVLEISPDAKGKVFTLKEYVENGHKINQVLDEMNVIYRRMEEKGEELAEEVIEGEFKEDQEKLKFLQEELPRLDIVDPFGQSLEIYRESAEEIEEVLKQLLDKLKTNGNKGSYQHNGKSF